ncbi:MAG: extracellular solute-binding protein [Gemmatimonadota bacterium]|nr:extracellular solute-binding protein [Gemmatimonadota bacterium]
MKGPGRPRASRPRVPARWRAGRFFLAVLLVAAGTGCGPEPDGEPGGDALRVLASPALARAADSLAAAWPGEREVVVEVEPTPEIVSRLGASESAPDVLLLDDSRDMSALWVAGEIDKAYRLGVDRLMLVVTGDDPRNVREVGDLARDDVRVSLPDSAVPLGRRAREVFRALGVEEAVEENRVGNPEDVRQVLDAVAEGRADAGLVYATSLTTGYRDRLRVFPLPQRISRPETLAIGIPVGAENPDEARAWVDFALSADGRAVLSRLGIGAPR